MANITTRINLRNDALSNWLTSTVQLNKGEVAFARLSGELSDKYEMRVGVGDKTWNELSNGGIMVPASNVVGLEDAIASLSTSFYETDDIAKLSDTASYVNGDIAVQKVDIDLSGHQQYTAYRWSEVNGTYQWAALDGNYSADNVYFPNDMTMTYAFGKYSVPESGSYTLSCAGKSVAAVINDAYAETKSGTVTPPNVTLTTTATLTGEVGATYTVPAATLKFTSGSYQYGPSPTGSVISAGNATVNCTEESTTKSNDSTLTNNGTVVLPAGATNAKSFADGSTVYNFTSTATYSDGAVPKNNIGGDDPAKKIAGATKTPSATCTATGHRYGFYGYRLASESRLDFDAMTSDNIRNGIHATKWDFTAGAWPSKFTVPTNSTQIIFAVPSSVIGTNHQYIKMSNVALGTYFFMNNGLLRNPTNNLSVDGAAADTGMAYAVWTINPADPFAAEAVYNIEYGATKKQ